MRRWAIVLPLALVAACGSSERTLWLASPDDTAVASQIFFLLPDNGPLSAYASAPAEREGALLLPVSLVAGEAGRVLALGFAAELSALGLAEGPVQSHGGPALEPLLIQSAAFDGESLSPWATESALPDSLAQFRLPEPGCSNFQLLPANIPGLVTALVPLDDRTALAMTVDECLHLGVDGQVLERIPIPVDGVRAANRAPGESVTWLAGARQFGRIELSPLRLELLATATTASIARGLTRWLSATPGPDTHVFGMTNEGAVLRFWPEPRFELMAVPKSDNNNLIQGGVVALGPEDVVASGHNSAYLYRWSQGQISRHTPPALVAGFDVIMRDGDQVLLADQFSGNLRHFDPSSSQWRDLGFETVPDIRWIVPVGARYFLGSGRGVLAELTLQGPCARPERLFSEGREGCILGDGLLVAGQPVPDGPSWLLLRPTR